MSKKHYSKEINLKISQIFIMYSFDRMPFYNTGEKITSELNGNKLLINVPTNSKRVTIVADTVVAPNGERCIIYDNYFFTINQIAQNATDINYYIGKMQIAANGINNGESWENVLKFMMTQHISKHGRIIDSDLMMICSALHRILEANRSNVSLPKLQLHSLAIARQNYLRDFFVTQFRRTPMGMEPSLVKATAFFKIQ